MDSFSRISNKVAIVANSLLIISVLMAVLMGIILPAGNGLSKTQIAQQESETTLLGLSDFVLRYESEHNGRWPQGLADLLPYVDGDIEVFYIRGKPESQRPADWLTNKARLDEYADYALPHDSSSGVLAFEKPGLWPDGTIAVGYIDGKVGRISARDFMVGASSPYSSHGKRISRAEFEALGIH